MSLLSNYLQDTPMKAVNSVGGFRIYPSSSAMAEAANRVVAAIGQLNDGMDRLNRERVLTDSQRAIIDSLPKDSPLTQKHHFLQMATRRIWQSALHCQRERNSQYGIHQNTLEDTGARLIACAEQWRQFKHDLDRKE